MSLLFPKRTKFRKQHRGRRKGLALTGCNVNFGTYGIQAIEPAWMTSNQIESARTAISRRLDRNSKMWIRVFPDKPVTKKPAETRQGKGKGDVDRWVAVIKPGRILFEFSGVSEDQAKRIEELVAHKLPFKTRLRRHMRLGGEL